MPQIIVAAFYQFADLPDYAQLQQPLLDCCHENDLRGTILLASEGINGTIAGNRSGIDAVLTMIRSDQRFADLEHKESTAADYPFHRMKVRLKKEIVSMGVPETSPARLVGTYLDATQWNDLVADPDVLVIDTRNDYEVAIGTFPGALSPNAETFREFPEFAQQQLADKKDRTIAMFCTGGIRCEKATSYLKANGFESVFHLRGGILKYLETVPEGDNRWQGECFVFDSRVSVDKRLSPGSYDLCHACRRPISDEDKVSPHYVPGVSCPYCIGDFTTDQREGFAERERQVRIAQSRGQQHIGLPLPDHDPQVKLTDADQALPVLYSFRRCPYAMRARLALAVAGVSVDLREILLKDKPAEMLAISSKGTVPVLQLPNGQVIDESIEVMRWALSQHDPDNWCGSEPGLTRQLTEENDGQFKAALDRYKYSTRYPEHPQAYYRAQGEGFLHKLETQLAAHDGKGLLRSDTSLADIAIFPFIRQFAGVDPKWFHNAGFPLLRQWLNAHVQSPRFIRIMKKYPLWLTARTMLVENWKAP